MTDQEADLLEAIIQREARSFLQFASEMYPWTRVSGTPALDTFEELARAERDAVGRLMKLLIRYRHVAPHLNPYPMVYTSLGFVALDYLVGKTAEHQRQDIAALERDRSALTDREVRAEVDTLLEMKRTHSKRWNRSNEILRKQNPKSEYRNPKQIRIPNEEIRNMKQTWPKTTPRNRTTLKSERFCLPGMYARSSSDCPGACVTSRM